jgi:hypothetical protein
MPSSIPAPTNPCSRPPNSYERSRCAKTARSPASKKSPITWVISTASDCLLSLGTEYARYLERCQGASCDFNAAGIPILSGRCDNLSLLRRLW